jgi:hypothetical protein
MEDHPTGRYSAPIRVERVGRRRFPRTVIAAILLVSACKREKPPTFKVVVDSSIDVPNVRETVPDQTAPELTEGMLAREAAAAIDARLPGLRRREQAMQLFGASVVVTAFIDSSGVRMVREHPAGPGAPGPNARYYFLDDELLYYESIVRVSGGSSTNHQTTRTVIGFDGHRGALEKTRTLDGNRARIDGAGVDSVLTRADQILTVLSSGSPPK